MSKRIFDIGFSIFGLLLLFPLLILISLIIVVDSQGPVFFRQVRVGKNGNLFRIHKFRTMYANSERSSRLTVGQRDHRITRIGYYLRKYKVDELPQLIDVFLGRMSVVGPRPEVPEFMSVYPPNIREKVLSVRPGITDNASIMMFNENDLLSDSSDPTYTYVQEILPIKQKLYCDYVDNHHFWGDIKIIFNTLLKIVR